MSLKAFEVEGFLRMTISPTGLRRVLSLIGRFISQTCVGFACVVLIHPSAEAEWRFSWLREPSTGEYSCSASSDPLPVQSGPGRTETVIRLGVQGEGFMTIRSDSVPFDAERLYETWIRVDNNRMVVRLSRSNGGRTLTFSEEDSVTLHRQFETGSVITVAMIFASRAEPLEARFSLEGYRLVTAQYKGCRGLLLNPGWLGLSMTEAPMDSDILSWIREHTPYQTAGIEIVTVDPRKEAFKSDIRPGDRVIGWNGKTAGEVKDLIFAMKNLEIGKSIELAVVRNRVLLQKTLTRPERAGREDE